MFAIMKLWHRKVLGHTQSPRKTQGWIPGIDIVVTVCSCGEIWGESS